jgi:molybdopterin converting factor small subunit
MKTSTNKNKSKVTMLMPHITPLLRGVVNMGINNKGKLSAIVAATTEVIASTVNGNILIPEAPSALDAMFQSPIEKGKEKVTENFNNDNVNTSEINIMQKNNEIVYDIWSDINRNGINVNLNEACLNIYNYIYKISGNAVEDQKYLVALCQDIPKNIQNIPEFNNAIIKVNTIVFLGALFKDQLGHDEYQNYLERVHNISKIIDQNKSLINNTDDYNKCKKTIYSLITGNLPKTFEIKLMPTEKTYLDILNNHSTYFARVKSRINGQSQSLGNETFDHDSDILKRHLEESYSKINEILKQQELLNIQNNINNLRENLEDDVKSKMNSIIGRSELMMEKIVKNIIPNLDNLYKLSEEKLQNFKSSILANPKFFSALGITIVAGISYYAYNYALLSSVKKFLGYFFLSFREPLVNNITDTLKNTIQNTVTNNDINIKGVRPTEVVGAGVIATSVLLQLLKKLKR